MGTDVLKLIVVGLVLAAMAVIYLIFSQRFTSSQIIQVTNTPTASLPQAVGGQASPSATVTPGLVQVTTTPTQAASGQPQGIRGGQFLPATGPSLFLIGLFSISLGLAGYFLRKYPK